VTPRTFLVTYVASILFLYFSSITAGPRLGTLTPMEMGMHVGTSPDPQIWPTLLGATPV
jgi:hypothetical protein